LGNGNVYHGGWRHKLHAMAGLCGARTPKPAVSSRHGHTTADIHSGHVRVQALESPADTCKSGWSSRTRGGK
jgi:hypothetical protein